MVEKNYRKAFLKQLKETIKIAYQRKQWKTTTFLWEKYADVEEIKWFFVGLFMESAVSGKDMDPFLRKESRFMLDVISQNGYMLEYADETLQKDKEFILEAVKRSSHAIFAAKYFQDDKDVLAIMHQT